jgi:hypothetical protein
VRSPLRHVPHVERDDGAQSAADVYLTVSAVDSHAATLTPLHQRSVKKP